jgi:hypothetical protein
MAMQLFEGFLEHPETYDACERFWDSLVSELAAQHGPNDWRQWTSRTWGNGTPMREGNPMCDARSTRLDRALRVIQEEPEGPEHFVVAYMEHQREFDEWPSHELVISLTLSEETLTVARQMLSLWLDPATTVELMTAMIDRIAPPSR